MKKPINNANDLLSELIGVFEMVRDDPRRIHQAKEATNTAGKIISLLQTQMVYDAAKKQRPDIPFLDSPLSLGRAPLALPATIKA